jgi:eukaryotic-like serine/threonine-protein kinase
VTDSPNPPDPRVGAVIQGRYKILALVASGGMGVIYRGERLQLGRAVAIKFLHPWVASQRSFLERFEVEARAMSRLSHPNCVSVIDFGVEDVPFLVMDFVAGRTLRLILETERLAPARALGFVRQILSGVAHAHAQGIIHRDLKPENIIVTDGAGLTDHVRILDFGLAKLHDGPALTAGMAIGTPAYMAPEQTLEVGVVDARTDVYAVGILLFEMLAGSKPFVSDKLAELIVMQQRQAAPRMSAVAGGATCSDALEAVVAKALAKAPTDRFSSADAMAAALEQVPESGAKRAGGAAQVFAPTVPGTSAAASGTADKTIVDKETIDKTIIDTTRHHDSAPRPERPRQGGAWKRFLIPLWRQRSRRQRWAGGLAAASALIVILVSALLPGRPKPRAAVEPPPAPPLAAAAAPVATDDLGPMAPDNTPGLADAVQLVRLGLRDQAITVLQEIRRNYPGSAYASFLLAVAYFEKLWWSVGLQHAEAAIQADPAYRRSPKLAKLLVYSLMSDSFWRKGGAFLEQEMADIAASYLEEAARSHRSPAVRARAAQILASNSPPASAASDGR